MAYSKYAMQNAASNVVTKIMKDSLRLHPVQRDGYCSQDQKDA